MGFWEKMDLPDLRKRVIFKHVVKMLSEKESFKKMDARVNLGLYMIYFNSHFMGSCIVYWGFGGSVLIKISMMFYVLKIEKAIVQIRNTY